MLASGRVQYSSSGCSILKIFMSFWSSNSCLLHYQAISDKSHQFSYHLTNEEENCKFGKRNFKISGEMRYSTGGVLNTENFHHFQQKNFVCPRNFFVILDLRNSDQHQKITKFSGFLEKNFFGKFSDFHLRILGFPDIIFFISGSKRGRRLKIL